MQDNTAYSKYVVSPFSFGSLIVNTLSSAFIIPGNAKIGISCTVNTLDDAFSVYVNGVEKIQLANTANSIREIGFLYKPYSLQLKRKSGLTTGTVNVFQYDYWNIPHLIASGTV
jgi:hypothetical protein